jgi:hypothetical protein
MYPHARTTAYQRWYAYVGTNVGSPTLVTLVRLRCTPTNVGTLGTPTETWQYCMDYNETMRDMGHICVISQAGIEKYADHNTEGGGGEVMDEPRSAEQG